MLLDDDRMNSVISRILSGLDNYECQNTLREDPTWDTISILSDLSVGTNLRSMPPSKRVPERDYYNESFDWMKRHQPEQLTSLCRLSTTSYYLRSRNHELSEYDRDKMFMKDAFLSPESSQNSSTCGGGPMKSQSFACSSKSAATSFVTRTRRDCESEEETSSEVDIEHTFSDSFVRLYPNSSSSFTSSSDCYDASSYSEGRSASEASRDDSTTFTSLSWKGDDSSTCASAPRHRGTVADKHRGTVADGGSSHPPPADHSCWSFQGMIQTCIEDECAIFADNIVAIENEEEELAVAFRYDGDSWSLWSSDSSSQGSY